MNAATIHAQRRERLIHLLRQLQGAVRRAPAPADDRTLPWPQRLRDARAASMLRADALRWLERFELDAYTAASDLDLHVIARASWAAVLMFIRGQQ